jgi:tRNA A37 threonylcarbamoyltransferase TsaD
MSGFFGEEGDLALGEVRDKVAKEAGVDGGRTEPRI